MTLSERQQIFSLNVAKLIQYIYEQGYACTLGECFRTKEQAEWYAEKGIGSKNSLHCKRLAIDLNLFKYGIYLTKEADYKFANDYWETLHPENKTGAGGGDANHFSMSETGQW